MLFVIGILLFGIGWAVSALLPDKPIELFAFILGMSGLVLVVVSVLAFAWQHMP